MYVATNVILKVWDLLFPIESINAYIYIYIYVVANISTYHFPHCKQIDESHISVDTSPLQKSVRRGLTMHDDNNGLKKCHKLQFGIWSIVLCCVLCFWRANIEKVNAKIYSSKGKACSQGDMESFFLGLPLQASFFTQPALNRGLDLHHLASHLSN
jgi:hypothetical protein